MHATKMHFALVQAANPKTAIGKMVLNVAVQHHEAMLAEEKARKEAKKKAALDRQKQLARLAVSVDPV